MTWLGNCILCYGHFVDLIWMPKNETRTDKNHLLISECGLLRGAWSRSSSRWNRNSPKVTTSGPPLTTQHFTCNLWHAQGSPLPPSSLPLLWEYQPDSTHIHDVLQYCKNDLGLIKKPLAWSVTVYLLQSRLWQYLSICCSYHGVSDDIVIPTRGRCKPYNQKLAIWVTT